MNKQIDAKKLTNRAPTMSEVLILSNQLTILNALALISVACNEAQAGKMLSHAENLLKKSKTTVEYLNYYTED